MDTLLLAGAKDEASQQDDKPMKTKEESPSFLVQLPPELLRHVYAFMDIPMLGTMAQVHTGNLQHFATENQIWSKLVKLRFGIATAAKRPKAFGGKDWKDSYRIMHGCHRVPKYRATSRKAVFAKGHGKLIASDGSNVVGAGLSVWVGINHTDSCRTRPLRTANFRADDAAAAAAGDNNNNDNMDNNNIPNQSTRRYVDLWICLQNPQSNGPPIEVNIAQSTLQFMGGMGNTYSEFWLQEQLLTSCGGGYRRIGPKMVYHKQQQEASRRRSSSSNNQQKRQQQQQSMFASLPSSPATTSMDDNDILRCGIITLPPMDFCVVSIPFECGQDAFETDALARAVNLQVPFSVADTTAAPRNSDYGGHYQQESAKQQSSFVSSFATAGFVSEGDIWEQYCALPGGCLTLSDRERRLHV